MRTFRNPSVRVLVDEAHQQAWSIRPSTAAAMQPQHPGDSSLAKAAALLAERDFVVDPLTEGAIDSSNLDGVGVLVLPHLSDPKFEATTGAGTPTYTEAEIAAIATFVESGGGLVVLAESEQDKYGNNLSELVARFGITLEHANVQDYTAFHQAPSWVRAEPAGRNGHPLLVDVDHVVLYRAGAVTTTGATSQVVLRSSATAAPAHAGVVATATYGQGRVVVLADSDLFGDDCIEEFDHATLWLNTLYYAALPAFAATVPGHDSSIVSNPDWLALKQATAELRLLQHPDGRIEGPASTSIRTHDLVEQMAVSVESLRPVFEHDQEYLTAVAADLRRWRTEGYGKPDFGASLDLFRPEQVRRDGIEHLVVFPMYTPNGSLDIRFEALIVRVPWPQFIDDLERAAFDNEKFVPVHLVDHTDGYDSECAVLFPETVSVSGPSANHFGGIFCDREAERYQRVVTSAVAATGLTLPPDIAALVANRPMTQDMFELWDLIHDRAHSHGELPFDPFMIRQRLPYWMYALEELRCDLTAFHEAGQLADEFPFARYVQFGVLFDRLFRFPITGARVRNYDGLAGQLLFGYLHEQEILSWRDNTLRIDWSRLPEAVDGLRRQIEQLYRSGISSTKVRYWIAAHDLVARYVQPTIASQWLPDRREGRDEADPKAWVSLVNPDEFPLSIFYQSLQAKLAPVITGEVAA